MAHKNKSNESPYTRRTTLSQRQQQTGGHKKPTDIFSVEEANDRLYDIFRNHDMNWITHEQRKQLCQFYVILMENQKVHNFTRLVNFRDIAIKHFIDCLVVKQITELKFPLLDMGTGPGFPGIPLKILFPQDKIILAEGVQKRVEFLKVVREKLELKELDIIGRNIDQTFVYPVNGVITRAVEEVSNTLKNVSQCLQVGGKVYLMKGPGVDPEIKSAKAEWKEYFKLVQDVAYELPKTTQARRLVVFEKIKALPLPDDDE
ncbi:MAG: 16S rRNA (guanine(527)-N(7))-methyltransferase RsmG [Bdellovibrionota bacterium]